MIRYFSSVFVAVLFAPDLTAQFVYDFEGLNGANPHPFIQLDGQDNWSEQTFNTSTRCGVAATRSHDGTQALRFQESGLETPLTFVLLVLFVGNIRGDREPIARYTRAGCLVDRAVFWPVT